MKLTTCSTNFFRNLACCGLLLFQPGLAFLPAEIRAADLPAVAERTKESVEDASRAVGKSLEDLWQRVDDSRLKNRTPDEVVAWVIMGVLAGAVAGMMTSLKTSGLGKLGRLLLGLAGAFVGGMVVHLGRIDFGWGPVLIRYEELLFSLVGAIALIAAARLIRSRAQKKPPQK